MLSRVKNRWYYTLVGNSPLATNIHYDMQSLSHLRLISDAFHSRKYIIKYIDRGVLIIFLIWVNVKPRYGALTLAFLVNNTFLWLLSNVRRGSWEITALWMAFRPPKATSIVY